MPVVFKQLVQVICSSSDNERLRPARGWLAGRSPRIERNPTTSPDTGKRAVSTLRRQSGLGKGFYLSGPQLCQRQFIAADIRKGVHRQPALSE